MNDFADVVHFFEIFRNDFVNLFRIVMRFFGLGDLPRIAVGIWDGSENVAHNSKRIGIVLRIVIGNT